MGGRFARMVLAGALCGAAGSCSGEDAPPSAEAAEPPASDLDALARIGADVRARSQARFALADFVKPAMDGEHGLDPYQAPLFYRELGSRDDALRPPELFGRVALGGDGLARVDHERPAVYFERSTAVVGGEERERLAFVWFSGGAPGELVPQGIRVTLGADGLAAAFEVLADSSGLDVIHATEPLEDAAAAAFGSPLEGRAFALERSLDDAPRTVVAGETATGPMALGPFVYLGRGGADVLGLHCRCEPSRADEIRANVEYELVPLDELRALGVEPPAWPDEPLDARLRLPPRREG